MKYNLHMGVKKQQIKLKTLIVGALASIGMVGTMALPALATSPSATDLSGNNWRVFNIDTSVAKLWEINKAAVLSGGGVQFPFQTSTTAGAWNGTGWFSPYFKTNYSVDLTGKTITAIVDVVAPPGTQFWTRSTT